MLYRPMLNSAYLRDTADIYAEITNVEGRPIVKGRDTPVYADVKISCLNINNTKLDRILGTTTSDRYTLKIPLSTTTYATITIKAGYLCYIIREGETAEIKLKITTVQDFNGAHWLCEAEKYGDV